MHGESATRPIVGCRGWTEAQARYMADFPVIELQTTFYQPPADSVAERWKSQSPPGFRFCMKAWQLITHPPSSPTYRRSKSVVGPRERDLYGSFRPTEQVGLAWERTRRIASILDVQVIVFQCPKSFLPTRENTRNLTTFFRDIHRDGRTLAWEPRGDDWRPELIRELRAESNLVHCVDLFKAEPTYGDTVYWRLHGKTGYRYVYTDEDLAELETKVQVHRDVPGPMYILFNNVYSKQDALRFIQRNEWRQSNFLRQSPKHCSPASPGAVCCAGKQISLPSIRSRGRDVKGRVQMRRNRTSIYDEPG